MQINESLLDERLGRMEEVHSWSPRVMSKLEGLIRSADDYALFRVNPLQFAADRHIAEEEAIDLFLYATTLGIFEMDWHLVCPTCATVVESFKELGGLHSHFVCPLCSNSSVTNLDDYIQVAFTITPQIRDIVYHHREMLVDRLSIQDYVFKYHVSRNVRAYEDQSYPEFMMSHTKAILYLRPGERTSVEYDAVPGFLYAQNVARASGVTYLVGENHQAGAQQIPLQLVGGRLETVGASLPAADLTFDDVKLKLEHVGTLDSGTLNIDVENRSDRKYPVWLIHFPINKPPRLLRFAPFLSAKRLLSTQTFLDLFRNVTTPGAEGLAVKDLSYLFTDLKGSTALYDAIGDPQAFYLVRQHFDTLMRVVTRHRGAIVKTIGDAVMATFLSPVDAVRAALDMRKDIEEFNRGISDKLVLKIGIHKGHAIAVTLNDRLDYFGQSINIAARIQNLADANEIFLSADVYDVPGVRDALSTYPVTRQQAIMKGVSGEMPVYKVAAPQAA